MIKFRKSRRDSELSLMSQAEVNRRSSAISLTGLRRDSLTGGEQINLTVPAYRRRGSTSGSVTGNQGNNDGDFTVLPAITKHVAPDVAMGDNVSIHSDEITIDFSSFSNDGSSNKKTEKADLPENEKNELKNEKSPMRKRKDTPAHFPEAMNIEQWNKYKTGSLDDGDIDPRQVSTASMAYTEGTTPGFKVNNDDLVKAIWKNILVMSVSFMLLFSSITALAALQASIHEGNLGVVGLAVNFGTVVVSCIVVPHLLIRLIGYKWTVAAGMLGGVFWMFLNIFGLWATVIPGSIILGLSWAPLWTAHSAYVTELSKKYAILTTTSVEEAISKFFGIFYTMFLTAPVWGNLVSAGVFGGFGGGDPLNQTIDEKEANRELLKYCGANFCPEEEVPENQTAVQIERPSFQQVALLGGINCGITLVGVILTAVFVDRADSPKLKLPPQVGGGETDNSHNFPIKELFLATLRQTIRKKQILMIPFPIYVGLEQAFIMAEFTTGYIGCAAGIEYVSLSVICYGVVGGVFAVLMGSVVKKTGRVPVFLVAAGVHVGLIIFMLLWRIQTDHIPLMFAVPGLWGLGDAIFQSQLNTMYGNMFSENAEAAFANYRMFESVGFILGYGYSGLLCVYIKLYILLALLVIAVAGYLLVEVWLVRQARGENGGSDAKGHQKVVKMAPVDAKTPGGGAVDTGSDGGKKKRRRSASLKPNLDTMVESEDEDAEAMKTVELKPQTNPQLQPSNTKPVTVESNC